MEKFKAVKELIHKTINESPVLVIGDEPQSFQF